ncbi:Agamous-like MADS-box protein AGL80 [Cardamine amara subsp. amara]|uniref:Agamous-like MADS-box protein AGL80 n=1 Tax=Cardamine amara subsp. amara TaxID=228776 RepID=A0ABD1AM95_CARAN
MTRKKVKLAFIANDSSRKATFKKRKKGLMKKVNELSTLCGVSACAIIYSPYDNNPEVWPSNSGVERVVSEFRKMPETDQHKKMVDQETFLRQRIAKATEQLRRQRKENRELEMTEVMFQSLAGNMGMFHLNILDLNDLGYIIDQNLKDIKHKIEISQNSGMEIGESSNVVAVEAASKGIGSLAVMASEIAPTTTINEVGSSSSATAFFNPLHRQQFRHPAAPHVGLYEQPRNLNLNLNQNHHQSQQQWFVEMMNQPEQLSSAGIEQMSFPFMDDNHHNGNHHHHHHHQLQQHHQEQQILGDSSIALGASSNGIIPTTSPNPTNNVWFR